MLLLNEPLDCAMCIQRYNMKNGMRTTMSFLFHNNFPTTGCFYNHPNMSSRSKQKCWLSNIARFKIPIVYPWWKGCKGSSKAFMDWSKSVKTLTIHSNIDIVTGSLHSNEIRPSHSCNFSTVNCTMSPSAILIPDSSFTHWFRSVSNVNPLFINESELSDKLFFCSTQLLARKSTTCKS